MIRQRPRAIGSDIAPFNMARSVTSSQLEKDITEILKDADLSKLSSKKIRKSLEDMYKTDLTDRKKEIDNLVMTLISTSQSTNSTSASGDADVKKTGSEKKKASLSPKKHNSSNENHYDSGSDNESNSEGKESEHSDSSEFEEASRPVLGGLVIANYITVTTDSETSCTEPENTSPPKKKKAKLSKDEELAKQLQQQEEEIGRRQTRGGGRKAAARPAKKGRKVSGDGDKGGPRKKNCYTELCILSESLAEVMGEEKMARSNVIKKMWEIIRERELLDPKNKQFMLCDDELYKVFGRKRIRTFGMMKFLKDHIYSPGDLVE
ncbi:hypothetical protein NP493_634g01009 [Ridgeia piscesae]|uniref:Upstream activation factor subunit spp27 n=1 Tax=Ridgeia piscesae TaxID=27915 RepID=A0AAD9KSY5_RIDPI|nr:hypothetical protein NP493_634g01009 [Ridgeia piscesae]